MRSVFPAAAIAALAAVSSAQVVMTVGSPTSPDHLLDFDNPFVTSGPIASASSTFTAHGIESVALLGSWTGGSDTITAGSNSAGQSLVSQLGVLSVAGVGQQLDGVGAGQGFELRFSAALNEFGVLFVDQINFTYRVEMFAGAASLGTANFLYGGSFPAPGHFWSVGSPFDRIQITWPSATAGVGIDNLALVLAAASTPTVYCTSGTSSAGCVPTIAASGQPSVSGAGATTLSIGGVEGQRTGLVFYGVNNAGFAPTAWGAGTSFLCVKAPLQRTPGQSSGGSAGACDGALNLDWNAFQAAASAPLGAPWSVGAKVYAQAWIHDPPAPKGSTLSNAIELTCAP